jgi:hypothetical protein
MNRRDELGGGLNASPIGQVTRIGEHHQGDLGGISLVHSSFTRTDSAGQAPPEGDSDYGLMPLPGDGSHMPGSHFNSMQTQRSCWGL